MDDDRLERALRQRPPDEPVYVPGSHRPPRSRARWLALTVPAIVAALIVGLAIGSGLPRDAGAGRVATRPIGDRRCHRRRDVGLELTADAWRDALLGHGSRTPSSMRPRARSIDSTVQYRLVFSDASLTVQAPTTAGRRSA